MPDQLANKDHAIVIGASMAGLLAARVLSDHFKKVTILERDRLPDAPELRRGVPQARHAHAMLSGGFQVITDLFPGICDELKARGALEADAQADGNWFVEGGLLDRTPMGSFGAMSSRLLLEHAVRERTLGLDAVELREGTTIRDLIVENGCVLGVRTEDAETFADLVVDCSGRGSKTPKWLAALGYPIPRAEEVEIHLVYTSRRFRRRSDDPDIFSVVPPTPEGKRGGVILAQEKDEWLCTLIGHFGQQAPEDVEGFRDYAKSLSGPCIYEAIHDTEPIGEASTTRFPASVRRRYELLDRFPDRLIVLGDALCSFNPIYGQGMSVASLEAVALSDALSGGLDGLSKRFFKCAAKIIDSPWKIAVGGDLKMPEVRGRRPLSLRFTNWYIRKLHRCGHTDAVATRAFLRVQQLQDPPEALMHPRIVLRVMRSLIGSPTFRKESEYDRAAKRESTMRAGSQRAQRRNAHEG